MMRLSKALQAWGTPDFTGILKSEIGQVRADELPLQQGLSHTSHVTDSRHEAIILSVADEGHVLRVKAGIFYSGIIAGCSCADDPTPISEQTEYCELWFNIDKLSAETTVELL
jgi:hypothetical protein